MCQQNVCQAVQVIIINILSIHISDITVVCSSRPSLSTHNVWCQQFLRICYEQYSTVYTVHNKFIEWPSFFNL